MHLSTLFHRIQSEGWTKSIADLHRNILRNVGKGWFTRVECRVRNWPFWSYCIFMFGSNERDVVGTPLQGSHMIIFLPDQRVRFPGCQM
jgi:hypothetical protein